MARQTEKNGIRKALKRVQDPAPETDYMVVVRRREDVKRKSGST